MLDTKNLCLQLYSVRDFFTEDYKGTVRKIAEMGYKGIEFALGYGNLSAPEMKSFLAECGLIPVGSHVPFKELKENIEAVIEYNNAIDNKYIVCPGAPLKVQDDFKAMCDTFNDFGRKCKENGLLFGYHNHHQEFVKFEDGSIGYDILLKGTAPDFVFFELDTCWVNFAGYDSVEYCKNYPGRFKLAHIKDHTGQKDEKGRAIQTDVGDGVVNFSRIIPALADNGTDYLIIEQEGGEGKSIEYVNRSLNNLKQIIGSL